MIHKLRETFLGLVEADKAQRQPAPLSQLCVAEMRRLRRILRASANPLSAMSRYLPARRRGILPNFRSYVAWSKADQSVQPPAV